MSMFLDITRHPVWFMRRHPAGRAADSPFLCCVQVATMEDVFGIRAALQGLPPVTSSAVAAELRPRIEALLDVGDIMVDLRSNTVEFCTRMVGLLAHARKRGEVLCAGCRKAFEKDTIPMCGGCRAEFYCGPACQKEHWRAHRKICKLINGRGRVYVPMCAAPGCAVGAVHGLFCDQHN
jgi:hypothetical protein